jgi:hypothetical protein
MDKFLTKKIPGSKANTIFPFKLITQQNSCLVLYGNTPRQHLPVKFMRYLLLPFFITLLFTSCNYHKHKEIQYDIYASVIDKKFGHFSPGIPNIIGINDTIKDFKDGLEILIYSVQNNDLFFKEYCKGDASFKNFILGVKTIKTGKEVMNLEKLKARTKININLNKLIKREPWRHTINFSKIVFNKVKDKAILFITDSSSGSWFLVESVNKKWTVKHEMLSWVI